MTRGPVTDEYICAIREIQLRDGMHEIHLREWSRCRCNWQNVLETREPGWSGTWCAECGLREEIIRLRALVLEWAEAHDELEDTGYWTDRYYSAGESLSNAVGKDFKQ